MKLIKSYLNFGNISLIALFLITLLLYLPSFSLHFSLLDDGLSVLNAKNFITAIADNDLDAVYSVFFEPVNGRVRPGYWLIQNIFVYLSFFNSYAFHILRYVLLLATIMVAGKLLKLLKVPSGFIFLGLFVFLFNIQNFENYYRLGPVEPYLVASIVATYYLLIQKKAGGIKIYFTLAILTLLTGLIKENYFLSGVTFIPFLVYSKLTGKKDLFNKSLVVILCSVISAVLVYLIKSGYPGGGVYASNYVLDSGKILRNLLSYVSMVRFYQSAIFDLSLLFFAYKLLTIFKNIRLGLRKLNLSDLFLIVLWFQVIVQLTALSPWTFVLNRYLGFVNICLILIYSISAAQIYELLTLKLKNSKTLNIPVITAIAFTVIISQSMVRNLFAIANYQLYSKTDSEVSYGAVSDLAKYIPRGETVYVNYKKGDSNIEIFEETKWHLDLFYARGDINFAYLDSQNFCFETDRFIFDRRSDRRVSENQFKNGNGFQIITENKSIYSPINYGVVLKSFRDRYRYLSWSDNYEFDWRIVKQKGGTCVKEI